MTICHNAFAGARTSNILALCTEVNCAQYLSASRQFDRACNIIAFANQIPSTPASHVYTSYTHDIVPDTGKAARAGCDWAPLTCQPRHVKGAVDRSGRSPRKTVTFGCPRYPTLYMSGATATTPLA